MYTRTTDNFFPRGTRQELRMEIHTEDRLAGSTIALGRPHNWVHHVISLLNAAMHRSAGLAGGFRWKGRLLAWQVHKVRDYLDGHIAGPVLVADLCALIQRSEAHFSRSFKRTFGASPHAFVIRRRLELAARYMLETDTCLSDIALRCGFADQAHLCNHFRQSTGEASGAWRRARKTEDFGNRAASSREGALVRSLARHDANKICCAN
jgi:AraC-like DNA-binding protein